MKVGELKKMILNCDNDFDVDIVIFTPLTFRSKSKMETVSADLESINYKEKTVKLLARVEV